MPPLCAVPQANRPPPHSPEAFRGGPLPAGSSPGRCERTLVLFPVQLFSPSLGSLLLQGFTWWFLAGQGSGEAFLGRFNGWRNFPSSPAVIITGSPCVA